MDSITYYNGIKSSYEGLYLREQTRKIRFLLSKFEIKPSYTVLDVGAGTGIFETMLARNCITALEPSDMANILAQRKLKNVSIVRETIGKFQTDKKFDLVFCITVLQDIVEEEREKAIEKMISLTNEGGFTIISVLKASGIDLSVLNPMESGEIENDRYFIFRK